VIPQEFPVKTFVELSRAVSGFARALPSLLLCFLVASAGCVYADIIEGGTGTIFGKDHAFNLTAPKGWVLDNESAAHQGIHAVFYPKSETWEDSAVTAYVGSLPRNRGFSSVEDVVKGNVANFRRDGHPHYEAQKIKPITTASGRRAVIYHYRGDKWGNYEAAAYFPEKKTINFVVLNCRTKKDFNKAIGPFEALVNSYMFMGDDPLKGQAGTGKKR